ncbi:hypothetical protein BC826DRAFT_1109136 [Russula brevipes]|nr:hypothetical protein BC826DRAFT_1109136 [Russula brevipes]
MLAPSHSFCHAFKGLSVNAARAGGLQAASSTQGLVLGLDESQSGAGHLAMLAAPSILSTTRLKDRYNKGFECENSNYDEFDGSAAPSDDDDQDYGPDSGRYNEDYEEENSNSGEFDGDATQSDEDETEFLRVLQESKAEARPTSPQIEDADWETRYDATRDRCQSAQEAHTQYTSNIKLVTEHNGTSGRHVDAHARHDRQSAEYADVGQRVPPAPPPLDGTIKAKIPPQSANPDRPADCLHHAGMWVTTHDAHQGNRCDPWLVPFAHALDFGDAISTEAEQQRNATILGRSSAECADSCQALGAAHAAMDNFRRTYDALCHQPGRTDNDNKHGEHLRDHGPHRRKAACRHGSSLSPSRALLHPASSRGRTL